MITKLSEVTFEGTAMKYLQLLADYMYPPLAWFDNPEYTDEELSNLKKIGKQPYIERPYFSEYVEDLDDFKKELGLSDGLCARIETWNNEFQATLADYPPDSCFSTPEDEERHWQEGLQIAQELAEHFRGKYRVEYYVNGRGKIWIPYTIGGIYSEVIKLRHLILTPTWNSTPIQIDYVDGFDEWLNLYGTYIAPENLNLSKKLCDDLWAWADLYNNQMTWDNSLDRLKWRQRKYDEFIRQGEALLERLRIELGDAYEVKRGNF